LEEQPVGRRFRGALVALASAAWAQRVWAADGVGTTAVGVVRQVSDRIGVMYLGRLVENAPAETLFRRPRHPYTRALMEAIPDLEMTGRQRIPVGGEVPSPINPPTGCAFHPRCALANARCKAERPEMILADDTLVACHAVEEGREA
jgi:peptide/nickel transport system ATP-binding protein